MIAGEEVDAEPDLFEVGNALEALGLGFGARESRQQHGRKNRDDGYNDKKFDEREALTVEAFHDGNL